MGLGAHARRHTDRGATRAGAAANDEAALLAPGWTALAAGDAASAGATAARVLGQFPNSAAALVLLVDADIARGGAIVALGAYESWLGARRLDDAYVLRRIARAALRQEMLGKDAAPRLQAMRGLASDGDLEAIGLLNDAAAQGRLTETLELARLGQDRAVLSLIKQLESPLPNRRAIIEALGQSRSALAAPPLVKLLGDPTKTRKPWPRTPSASLAQERPPARFDRCWPTRRNPFTSGSLRRARFTGWGSDWHRLSTGPRWTHPLTRRFGSRPQRA